MVGEVPVTDLGHLTMLKLPGVDRRSRRHRIELVQWPAGHADRMTAADFTV